MKLATLVFALGLAAGCEGSGTDEIDQRSYAVAPPADQPVTSVPHPKESGKRSAVCLGLVGGQVASEGDGIVLLVRETQVENGTPNEFYWKRCTGTVVGPRTVLTAARCLDDSATDLRVVDAEGFDQSNVQDRYAAGARPVRVIAALGTKFAALNATDEGDRLADVALIEYDRDLGQPLVDVEASPVKPATLVTLEGYGSADFATSDAAPTKRIGRNLIGANPATAMIFTQGKAETAAVDAEHVVAWLGDAGAPLLKDGKVVGVVSSVGRSEALSYNLAVPMSSAGAIELFSSAREAGFAIGKAPSPESPAETPVGEPAKVKVEPSRQEAPRAEEPVKSEASPDQDLCGG